MLAGFSIIRQTGKMTNNKDDEGANAYRMQKEFTRQM